MAHGLTAQVREATGGPWHVLVAGDELVPGSTDLRALCDPAAEPGADRRALDEASPGSRDVAVFLLSGGTTGLPKLIARTHDDYGYNARASAAVAGAGAGAVYLVSLPAGHNFPLARRVRPVLGARLQQAFGMAEGLLNYTRLDDPDEVICRTQGRPLSPADEIRLVDADDRDVAEGEAGSLLTRGPYTPRGYYRAAEQNARAFTPDGWYRSGDICRRTADGNLIVEGRDKDMINRGGEKVSAQEVENLAYQRPEVSEAAAVAAADPSVGERVCLYVVPHPGASVTLEQVRAGMEQAGVARFKFPEYLVIVSALPATKVGKIDKKALRDDITRRLAAQDGVQSVSRPARAST